MIITSTLMQTFNYFMSLDMPVMELLGSSETGGPQTACLKVAIVFPSSILTSIHNIMGYHGALSGPQTACLKVSIVFPFSLLFTTSLDIIGQEGLRLPASRFLITFSFCIHILNSHSAFSFCILIQYSQNERKTTIAL